MFLRALPLDFSQETPPSLSSAGLTPFRADIALHQAEPVHRQIELVAAGILQQQEVAADTADADVLQAAVQADAVVDMHHVIARLEFGQRGQDLLLAHLGDAAPPDPLAEQLFLGDQDQAGIREPETAGDVADQDGDGRSRRSALRLGTATSGKPASLMVQGIPYGVSSSLSRSACGC